MEKMRISNLEGLLKFPGSLNQTIPDASVLTCGCLVSEATFINESSPKCPTCGNPQVTILSEIKPLRELYKIVQQLNLQLNSTQTRRRSSSKKSIRLGSMDEGAKSMDLLSLFYKFAKEEEYSEKDVKPDTESDHAVALPIEINSKHEARFGSYQRPSNTLSLLPTSNIHNPSVSVSPLQFSVEKSLNTPPALRELNYEQNLLKSLNELKEYNFSKCFPFHRKMTTYSTQQSKFNIASMTLSMLKKTSRFTGSSIKTYLDFNLGAEITRFVLITEKRWELYECIVPTNEVDASNMKPQLVCCGKLTGEYGENMNSLNATQNTDLVTGEIIVRNNFNLNSSEVYSNDGDIKKRLKLWDFLDCQLSNNYLIISGTKGVMRAFNVNRMSPYGFGQPVYTYITNFPIRCIATTPKASLIACGITAREKTSGKEQPFIILHKMNMSEDNYLQSVEPITITSPYNDPIKIITFNAEATHLLCCTVWESRYLVIKLRSNKSSDNYKRPRLIWSDVVANATRRFRAKGENDTFVESVEADNELMMNDEGITDLQFGAKFSNTIFLSSCSLRSRPPAVIRLDGASLDANKQSTVSDSYSMSSIEEEEYSSIISSEVVMKVSEVGSQIHRCALSRRGDGIVFINKDGQVLLVTTSNFYTSNPTPMTRKVTVLLGEVANAERFPEAASVIFSSDGGKVFVVDRKGIFTVFDFTKGIPGEDVDVVKCKIINI
jgi:hypothetical protein